MASSITASLVIQFTDPSEGASGAVLQAEIDSRPDGYNHGITTFAQTDSPAYLVFKTSNVSFSTETTSGTAMRISSTVSIPMSEYLTFTKSNEATLSRPPSGSVSLTLVGGQSSAASFYGTRVVMKDKILAVYKAEYTTVAEAWKLMNAADPVVIIFLDGTAT